MSGRRRRGRHPVGGQDRQSEVATPQDVVGPSVLKGPRKLRVGPVTPGARPAAATLRAAGEALVALLPTQPVRFIGVVVPPGILAALRAVHAGVTGAQEELELDLVVFEGVGRRLPMHQSGGFSPCTGGTRGQGGG